MVMKDDIILANRVGWIASCASMVEAELKGLLAGLEMAQCLPLQDVDIVSDNMDALWSFCNGGSSVAQAAGLRNEDFSAFSRNLGWSLMRQQSLL